MSESEVSPERKPVEPSPQDSKPPNGGFTAWSAVAAGWLLFFISWGPSLGFGVFQEFYQTNYLSTYGSSRISWIGTTYSFFLLSAGAFLGPLLDRGYFFPIVTAGCVLNVLGFMTLSVSTEYYQIFLSQGVCLGIGSGVVYVPCTSLITGLFTTRRPMAMSLMLTGIGIGGVLFPIIFIRLVSEIGFPWATRTLGFISLFLATCSLVALSRVPPKSTRPRKLFEYQAFTEIPFVTFSLAGLLIFIAYYIPFFYLPSFATYVQGESSELSYYVISILNAGQTIGRLLPAFTVPRAGAFATTVLSVFASGIILFCWIAVRSTAGFLVWVVFYGIFTGSLISGAPLVCAHPVLSQLPVYATRWGIVTIMSAVGSLIGAPIAGVLAKPQTGYFLAAQAFAGSLMIAGAVLYCVPWVAAVRHDRQTCAREAGSRA